MKKQQQQQSKKGQSLISAGKISPIKWNISKSEAEIALKQFGIPVLELTLPWLKPLGFLRHCGLNILVAKVPRLTAFAARAR